MNLKSLWDGVVGAWKTHRPGNSTLLLIGAVLFLLALVAMTPTVAAVLAIALLVGALHEVTLLSARAERITQGLGSLSVINFSGPEDGDVIRGLADSKLPPDRPDATPEDLKSVDPELQRELEQFGTASAPSS